jgi:predicted TIM-barrel fold metal-dependent hydrolase
LYLPPAAPPLAAATADRIRLTAALRRNSSRSFTVQPELDPIWAACGRLGVPVLIHAGEPAAFFDPIDYYRDCHALVTV